MSAIGDLSPFSFRIFTTATFGREALRLQACCNLESIPRTQSELPPILVDIETLGHNVSRSGIESATFGRFSMPDLSVEGHVQS